MEREFVHRYVDDNLAECIVKAIHFFFDDIVEVWIFSLSKTRSFVAVAGAVANDRA